MGGGRAWLSKVQQLPSVNPLGVEHPSWDNSRRPGGTEPLLGEKHRNYSADGCTSCSVSERLSNQTLGPRLPENCPHTNPSPAPWQSSLGAAYPSRKAGNLGLSRGGPHHFSTDYFKGEQGSVAWT